MAETGTTICGVCWADLGGQHINQIIKGAGGIGMDYDFDPPNVVIGRLGAGLRITDADGAIVHECGDPDAATGGVSFHVKHANERGVRLTGHRWIKARRRRCQGGPFGAYRYATCRSTTRPAP